MTKLLARVLPLFAWGMLLSPLLSFGAEKLKCPICGMFFSEKAKTSFSSQRDSKPVRFCSYSCARRFHKKFPSVLIEAVDFSTGKPVPSDTAFFLIKSRNLLKELDFDMPPSVVAFASQSDAEWNQKRLKDGVIVQGFTALEKAFE